MKSLTFLLYGEPGVGKSWLSITAPGPRLYLDCEGRAVHLKTPQILWDPRSEQLPTQFPDGTPIHTDTTVVVNVRDYSEFAQAYSWLASGNHYFRSVIIDSLTELQQRCLDLIAGSEQVKTQDWGSLLRQMELLVRNFRDLRTHPTKPIEVLVVIAGAHEKDGRTRPMVQGSLSGRLASHFDLVGYLTLEYDAATQQLRRVLAISAYGAFTAKDNSDDLTRHYGMNIPNPNVEQMLAVLNGEASAT